MSVKYCQICGKQSGMFPLCKEHSQEAKNGLIIKNENSGLWDYKKNIEDKNINKNTSCLICGNKTTNGYLFCKECYYNIEDRKEELDKNQKPTKLKDYYYNAKDYAMRVFDESKIYYQKLTMVSLNELLKKLYNDTTLEERINKDLKNIDENLKLKNEKLKSSVKETSIIETIKEEKDKDKAKVKKSQDGHFVESELEITVDDVLYGQGIIHAYNIKVDEITERTVVCDWYLPVALGKGIYVELWGMVGNEKYNRNKQEKIDLYKKHNLPLIEITNAEVKNDTQRLISLIKSQYKALKEEIIKAL